MYKNKNKINIRNKMEKIRCIKENYIIFYKIDVYEMLDEENERRKV